MVDTVKISELPDGNVLVAGDSFAVVRGGVTHKIILPPVAGNVGILDGVVDTITLDATKSVLVNYATELEVGLFSGQLDQALGEITIPTSSVLCLINVLAIGSIGSPAANATTTMYLRVANTANDGDFPIAVADVSGVMSQQLGWSASFARFFPAGAVLSLVLEADSGLGTFTFLNTTFEAHLDI